MSLLLRQITHPSRIVTDASILGLSVADLYLTSVAIRSAAFAVSVLAIAALLLRRRHPVLALAAGLPNIVWGYALVAQLVATFTVAHRVHDRRRVAGMIGVVAVAQTVGMFLLPGDSSPVDYGAQRIVFAGLIVGGPATLGLLLRAYEQLARQVSELTAGRERERELVTRTVLAQERTRLAREMHDVVSHQVSLMAVQAGALAMTAPDEVTRATASTLRILAAKTLTELREMVTILRDGDQASDVFPQPRLGDLPRLVRDSGTGAVLRAEDVLDRDWPAPTQRAAYRTVQEALTNVRKHATGTDVIVELSGDAEGLSVLVRNGPPPRAPHLLDDRAGQLPGGGHGLIGLRERAEMLGGSLTHGHTGDGGFELVAKLPGRPQARHLRGPSATAAARV
jgi:signal transduction histidine kinase